MKMAGTRHYNTLYHLCCYSYPHPVSCNFLGIVYYKYMKREIQNKVKKAKLIIKSKTLNNKVKRVMLNKIESECKQDLFIKTHLCPCGTLEAEIWVKI